MLTGERGERIKSFLGGFGGVDDVELDVSMGGGVGEVVSFRLPLPFAFLAAAAAAEAKEDEDVSDSNEFRIVCGKDLDLVCCGVTVRVLLGVVVVVDATPRTGED